jgi:hypothetical protein
MGDIDEEDVEKMIDMVEEEVVENSRDTEGSDSEFQRHVTVDMSGLAVSVTVE